MAKKQQNPNQKQYKNQQQQQEAPAMSATQATNKQEQRGEDRQP